MHIVRRVIESFIRDRIDERIERCRFGMSSEIASVGDELVPVIEQPFILLHPAGRDVERVAVDGDEWFVFNEGGAAEECVAGGEHAAR